MVATIALPLAAAAGSTVTTTAQYVMLAGLMVIVTTLMILTHRRVRRSQRSGQPYVREQYADLARQSATRRDIDQAMVQLDQLAREIHGRLDTRFAKLEAVIRDADGRIDQLSRLIRASEGDQTIDVTLTSENPRQPPSEQALADHPHASVWRLADSVLSAAKNAQEIGKIPGEVELILALRRTKAQTADRNLARQFDSASAMASRQ